MTIFVIVPYTAFVHNTVSIIVHSDDAGGAIVIGINSTILVDVTIPIVIHTIYGILIDDPVLVIILVPQVPLINLSVPIIVDAGDTTLAIQVHIITGLFVDSREKRIIKVIIVIVIKEARKSQDISFSVMVVGDEEKGTAPDSARHALHGQQAFLVKPGPGTALAVGIKTGRKQGDGRGGDDP